MPADVNRDEVRSLLEQGAQLVEVLPKAEYEQEHLAGAINIPLKQLNRRTAARLARDRPIVVYCYDHQ